MERRSISEDDRDSGRGRGRDDDRGSRDRDRGRERDDRGDRDSGRGRDDDREERGSRDRGGRDEGRGGRGRDDDRGGRGGRSFTYQERDADTVRKRSSASGNSEFPLLSGKVESFSAGKGDNTIRVLPPTWKNAEHFGLDLFVHYGIGADRQSFACLDKMRGEPCPICDERRKAISQGDEEYADKLKPSKRVAFYLVDRDKAREGAKLWVAPFGFDRDLSALLQDKQSGELLYIDHPDRGYDVFFERQGEGIKTKYVGVNLARRDSPLKNDEALQFVQDNPIPEVINYYTYDQINKEFGGVIGKDKQDRDRDAGRGGRDRDKSRDDDRDSRDRGRERDDRGDRDSGRGRDRDDDRPSRSREKSWEDIHRMSYDDMCEYIDAEGLRIEPKESKNDEDLADWICEAKGIEKEERGGRDRDDDRGSRRRSED